MTRVQQLRQIGAKRPIYIWGARWNGVRIVRQLQSLGLAPAAFLDRDPDLADREVCGCRVMDPEAFWLTRPEKAFLILASEVHSEAMAEVCRAAGLAAGEDFLTLRELQSHDYYIEVAGACNLRCISCARGNYGGGQPRAGLMSLANYARVLDKIIREDPGASTVALYSWGEPTLNPELPEIIRETRRRGLDALVSSNLNLNHNLEAVIQAGPAYFKVSLSGRDENYARTHTGGDWDKVRQNLRRLKELKEKYQPGMQVDVGYHLYRHNCGEDRRRIKELVESLGFHHWEMTAFLMPYENLENIARKRPLTLAAREAESLLLVPSAEALDMVSTERGRPCCQDDALEINWDLAVKTCCLWYQDPDNLMTSPGGFLEKTLEEINSARQDSRLCRRCRALGIHRVMGVYLDKEVQARKIAALAL